MYIFDATVIPNQRIRLHLLEQNTINILSIVESVWIEVQSSLAKKDQHTIVSMKYNGSCTLNRHWQVNAVAQVFLNMTKLIRGFKTAQIQAHVCNTWGNRWGKGM